MRQRPATPAANANGDHTPLPHGWQRLPLYAICSQDRQIIEPQSPEATLRPYLGLDHIESTTGRILKDAADSPQSEGKSTTFAFDSRHVLYCKLRPYLNKVALPEFDGRCTTELIPLLPLPERMDRTFLALLLRRQETVAAAMAQKTGSRMPRADMAALLKLPVPVPPLPEQRRMAPRLSEQLTELSKGRAAAQSQLDAAQSLPAAYLRATFHGFVPLSVSITNAIPPKGWSWHDLRSLARLESGHTPSRYHPEWWGGSIPWIALPDIRALDGRVAKETHENTNEDGITNSSARVLPPGTVVLSRTASVGFVTVMGRPMATSQDFANWVCGAKLDPHFLSYLFQASRRHIRSLSSGAIHQTIYMPTLKQFRVCIPPLIKQQAITQQLSAQLDQAQSLEEALAARLSGLDHLPAALLREAFAGRI